MSNAAMMVHIGFPLTRGCASWAVRRAKSSASALRWTGVRPSSRLPFFSPFVSSHASSSASVAASRYPLTFAPPSPSCLPTASLRFLCAAFGSRGNLLFSRLTSFRHSAPAPCGPWQGVGDHFLRDIGGGRSTRSSRPPLFRHIRSPLNVMSPPVVQRGGRPQIGCVPAAGRGNGLWRHGASVETLRPKSSARNPNIRDNCSDAVVSAIRRGSPSRRAVSNSLRPGISCSSSFTAIRRDSHAGEFRERSGCEADQR